MRLTNITRRKIQSPPMIARLGLQPEHGAVARGIIFDTFTDTNGTLLSAHTIAPINAPGASWNTTVFDIQSNRARVIGGGFALLQSGVSDCTIIGTVNKSVGGGSAVIFARSNALSAPTAGWAIGPSNTAINIFELSGGYTLRASAAGTFTAGVDYLLTVSLAGNVITATIGAVTVSYTSATHATNTIHGLRSGEIGDTWDNFRIEVA